MSDAPSNTPVSQLSGPTAEAASPPELFNRRDWTAGAVTASVALAGYWWTLAPSVTLADAGEMLTAAYHLGVPRPPGYPLWTLCAWVWSHAIPFGNIAWRINLMSAFTCALACGLAALLVSSSGRRMVTRVGFMQTLRNQPLLDWILMGSSVCAGLLLAFCPVMWSRALLAAVEGPDALCLLAVLALLYGWSVEPQRLGRLYLAALFWGISLTANQESVLLLVAIPTFVWFIDRKLGRDLLVPILIAILAGIGCLMITPDSLFHEGGFSQSVFLAIVIGLVVWLRVLWRQGPSFMGRWPQVLLVYAAVLAGLSLYGYLFVAACTNPPVNCGYCSQWRGFIQHFTGTRLAGVHTERLPGHLWWQLNMFFHDLQAQFNIVYALSALLVLFFFLDLDERERSWMKFLFIAFLCLGIGCLFFNNPPLDKPRQAADHVFFLPCHVLYSLWIGYGLILGLGAVMAENSRLQRWGLPVAVMIALLPVVSIIRNWSRQEQRGHTFGYRFGYLLFKPGGGYSDLETNAILFAGTDSGRFVSAYMVYVESEASPRAKSQIPNCPESGSFDCRDVFVLSPSSLVQPAYLESIRDQYDNSRPRVDDPASLTSRSNIYRTIFNATGRLLGRDAMYPQSTIWIPSAQDVQALAARYVDDLRKRQPLPGEEVRLVNGRIQVTGSTSLVTLNRMLAREIYDHNKDQHPIYVEEGDVIPWMYPYLEPHGLILKLNTDKLAAISPEMVARDKMYWDTLTVDLLSDPKFMHDLEARQLFSKLRSAIGGLYSVRQMAAEAEYALDQARQLCPDNLESSTRLAQLYLNQRRFTEAISVLTDYQRQDPYNPTVQQDIAKIQQLDSQVRAIPELERLTLASPANVDLGMQLAQAYVISNVPDLLDARINVLVGTTSLAETNFLTLIKFDEQLNRTDHLLQLVSIFTQRYPKNPEGWVEFARILSLRGDCPDGMTALERAFALDGPDHMIRNQAQRDPALAGCLGLPEYRWLGSQSPSASSSSSSQSGLPFNISP